MNSDLRKLLARQAGLATYRQLRSVASRRELEILVGCDALQRIWRGVYSTVTPDTALKLYGLDLMSADSVVACLSTAAELYGFGTERDDVVHILQPESSYLRQQAGLSMRRREGAPIALVAGRRATAPCWTAIEYARTLKRPRALALLDASLRSGWCDRPGLLSALRTQAGRRGIVMVRGLVPIADGRSESPMESEVRLVILDAGLPKPELQYVIDGWRVDFAWPSVRLAAEYDSDEWHTDATAMRRDKARFAGLQRAGWTVVPITADDVRRNPTALISRLTWHLKQAA